MRIDDTDRDRNVEEALRPILEGLRWLGIDWDEGPEVGGPHAPYYQSRRVDRHRTAVERLIEVDAAYRDYATPEEIQAEREAARREGRPFVYSRRWMATTPAEAARFEAQGRRPVVRLKMPREGTLVVEDLVRGTVEFQWAQEQDHVIQRSDGSCLYHLASAVDDHDFQITHVIRAEEHLSNTPRQVFIARALGYPLPRYAHLPLVAEPGSRTKLSKRKLAKYLRNRDFAQLMEHGRRILERLGREVDLETFNPVIVDFYRQVGYLPEALLNYLALLGWSLDDRTEHFTREELVQRFSLEKVNRAPASFDPQKLRAFQVRHMLAVPVQRRVELVLPFLQQAGLVGSPPSAEERLRLTGVVEAAGDRIKVAGDILEFVEFFVPADRLPYDEKAVTKRLRQPPEAKGLVSRFREELATAERFEAEELERCLHGFVEREGIKVGQIIHALRVAITGKTVGLGMFETMAILGRQQCLDRIDRALGLV